MQSIEQQPSLVPYANQETEKKLKKLQELA